MLHIIGIILKIIGIILAVILGILVLLVCVVLFVPVRYEIEAVFPGDIEKIHARVKATWLLGLMSVRAVYEDGKAIWKARIAWKKMGEGAEKPLKKKRSPVKKAPGQEKTAGLEKEDAAEKAAEPERADAAEKSAEPEKSDAAEKVIEMERADAAEKVIELERADAAEKSAEPEEAGDGGKAEAEGNKDKMLENLDFEEKEIEKKILRASEKIEETVQEERDKYKKEAKKRLWQKVTDKVRDIFENIKYTFGVICDKIKKIAEGKDKILAFLGDKTHRDAWEKLKKEMPWIKRFLKPRRFQLKLRFGFDDPEKTGKALGALGILYSFLGEYMDIIPDFEEAVLEGEFYMKGTLRFVYLAAMAVKLLLDGNIRVTVRDIRNFKL